MKKPEIRLRKSAERVVFGLWKDAGDRTVSRDIGSLADEYHRVSALPKGTVFPYFVLSRNYDGQSGRFELFVGSTVEKPGLERLVLPAGDYARMEVRPKLGFLWGAAVGAAKRYFYTRWVPQSPYRPLNLEYEYHTEKSRGSRPAIDLLFAVEPVDGLKTGSGPEEES